MADANKPVRKPSFTVSNAMDTQWKGSLFDKLFPLRKSLFEKFPSANKGLAISGPGIKLGAGGNFSFVSNEKTDKVEYKESGMNFVARYKRDAKLFDVALKTNCPQYPAFNYLVKYEERKDGSQFILGGDFKTGGFEKNFKFNPLTLRAKASCLYSAPCMLYPDNKVNLAADSKFNLKQLNAADTSFNVGAAYTYKCLGTFAASYNHNGQLTLTAAKKMDNGFTFGIESVHACNSDPKKSPKQPLVVASIYEMDKTTAIKTKLNKDLQLNLAVKKEFNSNLTVVCGTAVNLQGNLFAPPTLGFKVTLKP